jgi:hypothetical protein
MFNRISALLSFALILDPLLGATGAVAQLSSASSTPVDVAYVTSQGAIETWTVDPATGTPTDQGQTLVAPVSFSLVPSADDHFVYIEGTDPTTNTEKLWVYATDSNGVPQATPVQTLGLLSGTGNLTIDPNGTLAYAGREYLDKQYNVFSSILLFRINPTTGILSGPTVAAEYDAGGLCSSQLDGGIPQLIGFNATGNRLYDDWDCSFHESGSVDYYALNVNKTTGSLSAGTQIFAWGISTGGGFDSVVFTPTNLIDFKVPNNYQTGVNSVNIYPPTGGTTPIFTCDASMLEACGYGTGMHVDLSGKFVFLETAPDNTQEQKLELATKQIVTTPYYIPEAITAFSPDDALIYSQNPYNTNPPFFYYIYTFNSATGAVSPGYPQIYTQQSFSTLVPAIRK